MEQQIPVWHRGPRLAFETDHLDSPQIKAANGLR